MTKTRFTQVTKALLYYTLLVILWGAWVRISKSGDGCGEHWPLCQGELIPSGATQKTWTELFHRLMSGVFGIYVFILFFYAQKQSKSVKKWMGFTLLFTITEALLGAKLVLFGLVGENNSYARAIVMSLHMLNSLLLVSAITMSILSTEKENPKINIRKWLTLFAGLAMTGAIASLATTLFPSTSLTDGLAKDLNENSPWILQLRIIHPILALLFAGHMAAYFYKRNKYLSGLFSVQLLVGIATLLLLSPVPLKLIHLFLVHWIWIHLVRWSADGK